MGEQLSLEKLQQLQREAEGSVCESDRRWEKFGAEVKLLKEQISQGQSTGDPIVDYVLVNRGYLDTPYLERLQLTDELLRAYRGEFLLVVTAREHFPGCTGLGYEPTSRDYVIEETIVLGVLSGEGLLIDAANGKLSLPTVRHATRYWGGQIRTEEGPLDMLYYFRDLAQYQVPVPRENPRNYRTVARRDPTGVSRQWGLEIEPYYVLDLRISDWQVGKWFARQGSSYERRYAELTDALSRPVPLRAEELAGARM